MKAEAGAVAGGEQLGPFPNKEKDFKPGFDQGEMENQYLQAYSAPLRKESGMYHELQQPQPQVTQMQNYQFTSKLEQLKEALLENNREKLSLFKKLQMGLLTSQQQNGNA